jgi:inorganic pyrophosphatase
MNLKSLSKGKKYPEEVNVVIEIPQNTGIKYEVDEESGEIFVDRFLYTAMQYPFNYGFVPETKAEDGDPYDVLVVSSQTVAPGTVLPARIVGMLEMEDEEGIDHKFIAVPRAKIDPYFAKINDVTDLDEIYREKIKHFFEHYKELEKGKWVKVKNFIGAKEAMNRLK